MSLSKQQIRYDDETVRARITVRKASLRDGLYRTKLADEGLRFPDTDPLVHAARWLQYPAVRAGTMAGKIEIWEPVEDPDSETGWLPVDKDSKPDQVIRAKEIDFDTWLDEMPEALMMEWLGAVFECNPHWVLARIPEVDSPEGKD
jgi:hypothetical protein